MDVDFDSSSLCLAELNPDQKETLTEYCLEQYDCECHPTLPEYVWPESPLESEHAHSASYQSETMFHGDSINIYPKHQGVTRDWGALKISTAPPNDRPRRPMPKQDKSFTPRVSARLREKRKQKELIGESISAPARESRVPRSRTECSNPGSGQTLPSVPLVDGDPAHSTQGPRSNVVPNGKRFACGWKRWFGGSCSRAFDDPYRHDMHIMSHLRDKEGRTFAVYKCMACNQRFVHLKACQRHARTVHKHDAELVELVGPGCWPVNLLKTRDYILQVLEVKHLTEDITQKKNADYPDTCDSGTVIGTSYPRSNCRKSVRIAEH